jgi:hypothetical protein
MTEGIFLLTAGAMLYQESGDDEIFLVLRRLT